MNCQICLNEGPNVFGIYNDCVIECLEKIKTHYMNFKKQLSDKDLIISALKETNSKLEKTIGYSEKIENKSRMKSNTGLEGREIQSSQMIENLNVDKSLDDHNIALNDEMEFEMSFINNSPEKHEKQIFLKREPMKTLNNDPSKSNCPSLENELTISTKGKREDNHSTGNKKTSRWLTKENETKRLTVGTFQRDSNRGRMHIKREHKPTNLSLKSVKFRQTRLKLDISKNMSNTGDSTFCEEAIEASPNSNSNSTLKKSNSSRQLLLRNINNKIDEPDNSIFNFSDPSSEHLKKEKLSSPKSQDNGSETSSVVMLTPATQDIIFLDDSCESFNIKSMDLLRGLMNPAETHLNNLRRMESNRIKMLQKTVGEKTEYHTNKCSDKTKKFLESSYKMKHDSGASTNMKMDDLEDICDQENNISNTKDENYELSRRERLYSVDCNECQTYIKYLGERLSNEEIERHIRNCSKHKKRIEVNLTPDGFWDPLIKSLDENDPRNETLIDDRFISIGK